MPPQDPKESMFLILGGAMFPGADADDLDIACFLKNEFGLSGDPTTRNKIFSLLSQVECREAIVKACGDGDFVRVGQVLEDGGLFVGAKNPLEYTSAAPSRDRGDPNVLSSLGVSFKCEYVGEAAEGLYEYLKKNEELFNPNRMTENRYYAKFCSIVQSSGTGKSRTMIELRNKGVIVLYMNLRDGKEKNTFPVRDDIIADILAKSPRTEEEYGDHCYALFTAIFRVLLSTFEEYSVNTSDPKVLIKRWNDEMCDFGWDKREQWFEKVKVEYNRAFGIEATPGVRMSQDAQDPNRPGRPALVDAFNAWQDFASKNLVFDSDPNHPQLVIAFDEAHTLSNRQEYRPYHILCRTIKAISQYPSPTWVIFASTTSQVLDLPPPSAIRGSHRVSEGGSVLFPPYMHFGWDQNAKDITAMMPEDVANLDYIVCLGRPLWASLMNVMDVPMFVRAVIKKLCGGTMYDSGQEYHVLAALGARFCIDISLGHVGSNEFNAKAVGRHMRILESITPNGHWLSTSYPSEPLLACVAAKCLHQPSESVYETTALDQSLKILCKKILSGMVDAGNEGELLSRVLLLVGKDFYCRSLSTWSQDILNKSDKLPDCAPVSVAGYLRFMFGKDIVSEAAEKQLDGWCMNFTHWVRMTGVLRDPTEPELVVRQDFGKLHWFRTSAVQCSQNQGYIDKVIPIYRMDSQTEFSQILICDRVRDRSSKNDLDCITHEAVFGYDSGKPYVVIMLDMGVPASEPKATWAEDGRVGHIYVSGMDATSLPFLEGHSDMLSFLSRMIKLEMAPDPTPIVSKLAGRFDVGRTLGNNMLWFIGSDKYEEYQTEYVQKSAWLPKVDKASGNKAAR